MRSEDVKIGMKVVPHSKSVGVDLGSSIIMKNALKQNQSYMFQHE